MARLEDIPQPTRDLTETVIVALDLHHRTISSQTRLIEHAFEPTTLSEVPFRSLHKDRCAGKHGDVTDMVDVAVSEADIADRRRFDIGQVIFVAFDIKLGSLGRCGCQYRRFRCRQAAIDCTGSGCIRENPTPGDYL